MGRGRRPPSSSSSRSACPSLSHRMIVGIPSRTRRLSCRMSRSIASGGRIGNMTSGSASPASTAVIVPSFGNRRERDVGASNSSSRLGASSPRRRARSMWCWASSQVRCELRLDVRAARDDEQRVGRKERQRSIRARIARLRPRSRSRRREEPARGRPLGSNAASRDRSGAGPRSHRPRTRRAPARPCRTSRRRRFRREC